MTERTVNLVAAALGGEGGGVFTNWLADVAEREGWICQTTALAGVAQRTGATIYYLEFFPRSSRHEEIPVMSLFPAQGDIDIAVASEIAEAARMVQRGFVTADRTTLIASDHRVYSIGEKQGLGDSTADAEHLSEVAGRYSKEFIHYDMLKLANDHGAVISSVLLGAVAGSEVLPFAKSSFEDVIRSSGKSVDVNLAAFEASAEKARLRGVEVFTPESKSLGEFKLPAAQTEKGRELLDQILTFPSLLHEVLYHGVSKCVDYQDHAYASWYLAQCESMYTLENKTNGPVTMQVARYLALWMCYEDIPRVAQLKTRLSRVENIRREVKAAPNQILYITEFFSPRIEEMCAIMPKVIGDRILKSSFAKAVLKLFTGGKKLRTDGVFVFVLLRILASFRVIRRSSLGYEYEHKMIHRWLSSVMNALAKKDSVRALALARCGRLVKGYGETRHRTTSQLMDIVDKGASLPSERIESLKYAALDDDTGEGLAKMFDSVA